jgi:hypothetical protein
MSSALDIAPPPRSPITFRSVVLGVLTVVALSVYTNHAGLVMGSSSLVKSQFPMAMLLPFTLWIFINIGLKAFVPRIALSGTELLVIYSMSWIAGVIPLEGWAAYLVSSISVPTFYASPENRWESVIFDKLPWWLLTERAPGVIRPFYDGLAPGDSIPWMHWTRPLFWWTAIGLAVVSAGTCLCAIFQRQWEDAERLTYPLAQFAAELTSGFDEPSRVPALFRNRIFWFGFFTVFAVFLWNMVGYFNHAIPRISIYGGYLGKQIDLARDFPPIYLRILPSVVGLTYFCDLDILFSFWFLRMVAILKLGLMARVGFTVGLKDQQIDGAGIVALESHGALIVLAIWTFFVARGHLARVWVAIREGRAHPYNDGVAPYRTIALILLASTTFIVGWMMAVGMSLPVACLQTALIYTAYLTVAKFTAASGFTHLLPVFAKGGGALKQFIGTSSMRPGDFVGVELVNSSTFFGNDRIPSWPALPHHFRLFGDRARPLIMWLAPIAFAVGLIASFTSIVYLAYTEGGQNLHTAPFTGRSNSAAVRLWDNMTRDITGNTPTVFDPAKMLVWLIGGLEAILFVALRNRATWWPLHPIGLAFQNTSGPRIYAFSIFLTWASKSLLLRIGGIALYRRAAPYFIGLPIGYVTGIAVSSLVDLLWFPTRGHGTHGW